MLVIVIHRQKRRDYTILLILYYLKEVKSFTKIMKMSPKLGRNHQNRNKFRLAKSTPTHSLRTLRKPFKKTTTTVTVAANLLIIIRIVRRAPRDQLAPSLCCSFVRSCLLVDNRLQQQRHTPPHDLFHLRINP